MLEKYDLKCWAISNHLVGQAVCDDPIDERHQDILPARIWGDGEPEGVRQRAAEEMKTPRGPRPRSACETVIGFTGSSIWQTVAMFPPVPDAMIDAGYQDFADRWNPILDVFDEVGVRFAHEVHPSEIAYDYWTTRRTLEAIGHRAGVRPQLGPEPLRVAGPRPGRLPLRLRRPDLPRRLQGPASGSTAATAGWARTCPGPTRAAAGTSCRPATATCRGRTSSGCSTRSATTDRSPSSGRTPAWTGSSVRPRRWSSCAGSTSTRRGRLRRRLQLQPRLAEGFAGEQAGHGDLLAGQQARAISSRG